MSEKVPPHDWEVEHAVIGGLLSGMDFAEVRDRVKAADFHHRGDRTIFEVVTALVAAGGEPGHAVVAAELRMRGLLDAAGGHAHLRTCIERACIPAILGAYASRIREYARRRRLQESIRGLDEEIASGKATADELLSRLDALRKEAEGDTSAGAWRSYADIIPPALEAVYQRLQSPGQSDGLTTTIPEVDRWIGGLQPGRLYILAGRPKMGKAQPLTAKVLTPTGWRRMGDLAVGDLVIGANGKPTAVTGVYPQGVRPVFRVTTGDGAVTECCDEHLWFTQTREDRRNGRTGGVRELRQIRESLHIEGGRRANHYLPFVAPVEFVQRDALQIHPYLFGLWLGDGSSSFNAIISNPEPDIRERIVSLVPSGDTAVLCDDGITTRIKREKKNNQPSEMMMALRAMGLVGVDSLTKWIPDSYLMGSVETRVALLRGLCDTDGYVIGGGNAVEVSFSSERLAVGFRFLVRSLGGYVTCRKRTPHYTHKGERKAGAPSYRMLASFPNGLCPVSSAKHLARWRGARPRLRTIESVEPAGEAECQCITVDAPDRLYVTDDFIVTHNSAIAQQISEANGARGVVTAVFELEMSERGWAERTLAHQSRINADAIRRGEMTAEQWAHVCAMGEAAMPWPVYLDTTARLPIGQIRQRARRLHADKGLGLIVVDYLQLSRADVKRGGSRENEVAEISMSLKQLSKELNVPVLALAQLNRACESRTNKRPMPSDLRESGSLEQDADAILLAYRDEVYNPDTPDKGIMEIIVGACRDGQTGTAKVRWTGEHYRLDPLDARHADSDRPASRWASNAGGGYEY